MEEKNNRRMIKQLELGNTHVEVYVEGPEPTIEEKRNHLKKIYDTVHKIARQAERRGVDTSKWFYTDEQIKELKKDPQNKFI